MEDQSAGREGYREGIREDSRVDFREGGRVGFREGPKVVCRGAFREGIARMDCAHFSLLRLPGRGGGGNKVVGSDSPCFRFFIDPIKI